MSKKLLKWIGTGIGIPLMFILTGSLALAAEKEMNLYEYTHLPREQRLKYKTIVVEPYEKGTTPSEIELKKAEEMILSGETETVWKYYQLALFEATHPKVKVKLSTYSGWKAEELLTGLAGGTAPSYYDITQEAGPAGYIKQGLVADITDLVKNWDQTPYIQSHYGALWECCWDKGRCYGIPTVDPMIPCIYGFLYRKDWCKEAGIFNGKGEGGPPLNWTIKEFREIFMKLTDPKKNRWGLTVGPVQWHWGLKNPAFQCMRAPFGTQPWFWTVPDKSGKYTWRFDTSPQVVESLEFLRDMIWKDKSIITGAEYSGGEVNREFWGNRAGAYYFRNMDGIGKVFGAPHVFSPTIPTEEILGFAPVPAGKYGLRLNTRRVSFNGFNPTLSKEELKAAFEYADWIRVGEGATISLEYSLHNWRTIGKTLPLELARTTLPWQTLVSQTKEFPGSLRIRKVPEGFPDILKMIPEGMLDATRVSLKIPAYTNFFRATDLTVPGLGKELAGLMSLYQAIASNPNVDIEKELKKTADMLNATVFNVKLENDREALKEYFQGLDNFYKEYYPDWWKSKEYKDLFENYYKCW